MQCKIITSTIIDATVNATGSRWVPHHFRALKVVCKNYKVIHVHMHEVAAAGTSSATMQGRARNTIGKMESYKHIAFMFFMLDVLDELQKLSLTFQKDEVGVSDVKNSVERTGLALRALLGRAGTNLRRFEQSLNDSLHETASLTRRQNDDAEFTNLKETVVNAINQYVVNRF